MAISTISVNFGDSCLVVTIALLEISCLSNSVTTRHKIKLIHSFMHVRRATSAPSSHVRGVNMLVIRDLL